MAIDERVCDLKHDALCKQIGLLFDRVNIRLDSNDAALILQTTNLKEHLEKLNKSYERQIDDRNNFITKTQYEDKHEILIDKINTMLLDIAKMETRYEGRILWASIASLMSLLLAATAILVPWLLHK
jgi:adenylosuccinate synthase